MNHESLQMFTQRDVGQVYHVYPTFGREHLIESIRCWCNPIEDKVERYDGTFGYVIVHNAEDASGDN